MNHKESELQQLLEDQTRALMNVQDAKKTSVKEYNSEIKEIKKEIEIIMKELNEMKGM